MSSVAMSNGAGGTPSLLPRDARLIALLLAANGAEDCEEGVVRMLVEFAHRYTSDVLSDSLMYAEHAKAGSSGANLSNLVPSLDDVRLAVQARTEGATVPKEFLLQLATDVNAAPLPPVPEVYGIRLPPAASRLTAPNFSIIPRSSKIITSNDTIAKEQNRMSPSNVLGGKAKEKDTSKPNSDAGGSDKGEGLFGEDDEDEDEDDDNNDNDEDDDAEPEREGEEDTNRQDQDNDNVDEEEDDDDDDEEMEDVTSGVGGSGSLSDPYKGAKRKAGESDEEYD